MNGYLRLLRLPGAGRFVSAGFIGRLPISMLSLGVVLLVTAQSGSYALAGALSATVALAAAFVSPLGLRWADRAGQSRAVPVLVAAQSTALVLFTMSVVRDFPVTVQFLLAFIAGATGPHVGSLVRARWAAQLSGTPQLGSAFALEAVIDEMVFIVGPPLMTVLALQWGEAAAMYSCAALILTGALWLASQTSSQPPVHRRSPGHGPQPLMSAGLVAVVLIMVLLGGVFGSFEVTSIAFTRALGYEQLIGAVLALYACGSLISGLLLGLRQPPADPRRRVVLSAGFLAVVSAPLMLVQHIAPLMALAFLAGLAVSPLLIVTTTIIEQMVPGSRLTEALGISVSGIAVGLAVGSTSSGALIDAVSADAGYTFMAVCGVGSLLVAAAGHGLMRPSLRAPS